MGGAAAPGGAGGRQAGGSCRFSSWEKPLTAIWRESRGDRGLWMQTGLGSSPRDPESLGGQGAVEPARAVARPPPATEVSQGTGGSHSGREGVGPQGSGTRMRRRMAPSLSGQSSQPSLTSHLPPASVSPSCLEQRGAQCCEGRRPPPPIPPHLPRVRRLDEITSVRCRCRGRGVRWTCGGGVDTACGCSELPHSRPPARPAAHPGDLGPNVAWDVNLGIEEGKRTETGL